MRTYLSAATAILVLGALSSECSADARSDSLNLLGAWKWSSSEGGLVDALVTPGPGWNRFLSFDSKGAYALWERDSVGDDVVCQGRFTVHRYPAHQKPQLWVELQGCRRPFDDQYQIFFEGRDTLRTYPGGGNKIVFDALTDMWVRDSKEPALRTAATKPRPRGTPNHPSVVKTYSHSIQSTGLNQPPEIPVSRDSTR